MFKKMYIVPLLLLTIIGMCLIIKTSFAEEQKDIFGSISGKVTIENEITGIKGVYVEVKDKEGKKPLDIDETNADGFYKIRRLAPGTYQLEVEEEGFVTIIKKDVVIQTGEETKDVNFILTKPNSISGRVLKADGKTSDSGIWLIIKKLDSDYADSAFSDVNGVYKIENLPEGIYRLFAIRKGKTLGIKENIEIKKDTILTDVNIIISEPEKYGSISGKVLKSDGKTPVSGVSVFTFGKKGEGRDSLSDKNGKYKIEKLTEDTYQIIVFASDGKEIGSRENVEVKTKEQITNIDIITTLR